jgi:hypothetical protein
MLALRQPRPDPIGRKAMNPWPPWTLGSHSNELPSPPFTTASPIGDVPLD